MSRTVPAHGKALCGSAGFTLVEVLVTLALVALLMAAVPATLRFAKRAADAAAALDRGNEAEAGLALAEQRLAETTAIYDRGDDGRLRIIFTGAADSVVFIAPQTFESGISGLVRFELRIADAATLAPGGLALSWTPWRSLPADGIAPPPFVTNSRLLIPQARDLQLRYYGAPALGEDPDWFDAWRRTDTIPDAIELTVVAAGEPRLRRIVLRLKPP